MTSDKNILIVRVLMTLLCVLFGAARLYMPVVSEVHREDIFKDLAHILVGQICGMAIGFSLTWRTVRHARNLIAQQQPGHQTVLVLGDLKDCFRELCGYFWIMFWVMVGLEITAFLMHKP